MPIYEFTSTQIRPLEETKFDLAGVQERRDLQRLLREQIEVIAPDTLLISEEFGDWEILGDVSIYWRSTRTPIWSLSS